jgi:Ca2+-transporting ATPase
MRALLVGVLCSNADYNPLEQSGTGDPMEVALLRAGSFAGLHRGEQVDAFPEIAEHPFDPRTKRMATVHRQASGYFAAVKGAPEHVLATADQIGVDARPLEESDRAAWLARAAALAAEGLRVIAVAIRSEAEPREPVGRGLAFLGLVAFRDPPRSDIAESVAALHHAGMGVVMATGDHPSTALSISRAVGIAEAKATVIAGSELPPFEELTAARRREIANTRVFARVTPEQKLELLDLFQRDGQVVAMVGDGVNDAAALAQADLGLAMGTGTDVAIAAGDLTLVSGDLRLAADAIRLARRTLGTIRGNLFWAFAYNVAAIPLAAAGLLDPMVAGAAMACSSLFVVGNSLRLRRFR